MRRLAPIVLTLALVGGGAVMAAAGDGPDGTSYDVELDNAFGLTVGADLRSAGVKIGSVDDLQIDAKTARAIATVSIDRPEFAGFRKDVFCVVEPQSLIGEYFLDCEPGKDPQTLADGSRIPVEQTGGTVPADLVNNIMRRPYRERLGILIAELGATFASRGDDVNKTIGRAVPALRETDKVLRILADERETLRQLTRDGETVITRLAKDRDGVARFVAEARDTAAASADRRTDLATTIRLLPDFQRELRPSLEALGEAARKQTPALADLRAAAPTLTRLIKRLGPFSEASRPAIRSLARTSDTGRRAVAAARPTVAQLNRTATKSKDPFTNLRFILEHVNDRRHAVEPNPLSPGGKGFTGLEALLQYPFVQSQAINIFDVKGYILKLNILINECGAYTDARGRLSDPERAKKCNADLGPGAPSLQEAAAKEQAYAAGANPRSSDAGTRRAASAGDAPAAGSGQGSASGQASGPGGSATGDRLSLPGLPPIDLRKPGRRPQTDAAQPLLDLLLRP